MKDLVIDEGGVVVIGGYQCVSAKFINDIDLNTFVQETPRIPMKVVDDDGNTLFRIEPGEGVERDGLLPPLAL